MTPAWFTDAIASAPTRSTSECGGAQTALRSWGAPGAPLLVLVHGGAAHAGWWDHLAPPLASTRRVVSVDLAGHGDSAWLTQYSLRGWSRQVCAVVRREAGPRPAVLVGHSMGGLVALLAAHELGSAVAGLVMVDTEVPADLASARRAAWTPPTARRVSSDRGALVQRFRTLPADVPHLPYVERHVAESSVTGVAGGWAWKFDPGFAAHDRISLGDLDPLVDAQLLLVRGEHGLVDPALGVSTTEALGRPHRPVTVPGSGHHILLDDPSALISILDATTRAWADGTSSTPRPTTCEGARP